jgi:hypothetical protein
MFKQLSILSLVTAVCVNAMDLAQHGIIKIDNIKSRDSIDLYHSPNGFAVVKGSDAQPVNSCFVDPILRKMNQRQLKQFEKHGYIDITRMSDGNYALRAKVRGNGGGPVTGWFLYGLTKAVAYGGIGAAVAAATTATGGAVGAAVGITGATASSTAGLAMAATQCAVTTGFVTGGPLGAAGAYAGALAALPTAAAGIESGALMIGTAASFIPGLP